MASDPMHDRLLAIVKTLPGAYEDRPWGSVHCKVNGKIFVGWGRDDGEMSLGFKTSKPLQAMLVASDARFTVAKYVGKHGWVDMRLGARPNWAEVEQFIADSYRMIAPKKLVKQLDGGGAAAEQTPAKKKPAAKGRASKPRR
jgi:predicted DNA-binding protein (MmcQ/YjbR family)